MGALRKALRADESRRTTSLAVGAPLPVLARLRTPGLSLVAALALAIGGCAEPLTTSDVPDSGSPAPAGTSSAGEVSETPDPTPAPTPAASPGSPGSPAVEPASEPARGTTLAALGGLAVKGRAARTGYDRAQFGPAWLDADRNGCDTRNDMLRRDLREIVVKPGTNGCVVVTGHLLDDYTGQRIDHARGSSVVDIDHRVSLSNAWQTGAAAWTLEKRAAFANDPLNLAATDAAANSAKGDGDAATWLPPNKPYRCDFVATQVAVKAKYDLWVTPPEQAAIVRVLEACPDHQLPADPTAAPTEVDHNLQPVPTASPKPTPTPTPKPKPKPKTFADVPQDVHFQNCTAARDAGAAPVTRGDPGYGRHLDRDGDGVGCE